MTDARTRLSRFGSKLITFHPAPGANVNALIDVIPDLAALVLVAALATASSECWGPWVGCRENSLHHVLG